jgi:hypothetical protein
VATMVTRTHHSVNLLRIVYLDVHIRKMIIDFLAYACAVLVFLGELNGVKSTLMGPYILRIF